MNVKTDDRQRDHATQKFEGIGGFACTERAIPPKNLLDRLNRNLKRNIFVR